MRKLTIACVSCLLALWPAAARFFAPASCFASPKSRKPIAEQEGRISPLTIQFPLVRHALLALALLVASCPFAPVAAGDSERPPPLNCSTTVERLFPGDYYFCVGSKAVRRGRYSHALEMYESAARWGDKRAQFNLGLMYLRGDHVPANQALGLAWLALAAERPESSRERWVLENAYTLAPPEVRRQADVLWTRMRATYADAVALERARTRYDREARGIMRLQTRDPAASYVIRGLGSGLALGIGEATPAGSVAGMAKVLEERAEVLLDSPRKGQVRVGEVQKVDSPPEPDEQQAQDESPP